MRAVLLVGRDACRVSRRCAASPEVGLTREYVARGRIGSRIFRIDGVTRDTRTAPPGRHVPGMNPPPTTETTMRTRTLTLAGATLAGATLLAACGSGGGGSSQAAASAHRTRTAPAATAATIGVHATALGDVLVDAQGRTLYGFVNDTNGTPTCTGACAQNWPPLRVGATWTTGSGVDRVNFHVVGTGAAMQLASAKWPLYTFAGDRRPGDVNGQGVERFYAVAPDGTLIKSASTAGSSSPTTAPAMSSSGY
jgi:predicted lipoprotein with Yx(FWY)xxD motif